MKKTLSKCYTVIVRWKAIFLTYGKIFVFETSEGKIDFSKPKNCIKIGRGQVEALAYINNTDFIVTNEQRKIYKVSLRR